MIKILGLFLLLVTFLFGAYWFNSQEFVVPEQTQDEVVESESFSEQQVIDTFLAPLVPIEIDEKVYRVSLAATDEERVRGLSDTPFLPNDVIKLFVFDNEDLWGIWMKDMNYSLDIIWLDSDGMVVYKELHVSPDTYPTVFRPEIPALYVIEAVSGFAEENAIEVGTSIDLQGVL